MKNEERDRFLRSMLENTTGSDESCEMYIEVDTNNGLSEIVIKKTITERMPVQRIGDARDLFDRLTCGRGRKAFKLEDLALK